MAYTSTQERAFLDQERPRTPVFYTLPKIHKNEFHPPGRPIVSD